jgi:hypothetical protein
MWNPFNLGIAIDERLPSLGAPKAVAHRSTALKAATRYCQMVRGEYDALCEASISIGPWVRCPEGTGLRKVRAV